MGDRARIFKRNGRSIKFYLVAGPTYVTDEGGLTGRDVEDLATAIEEHGGAVCDQINDAEIWIVDNNALDTYAKYCAHDPDHRAEGVAFVRKCVQRRTFQEELLEEKKPMAGRYAGKRRFFTDEEIELLCQWLAIKIPDNAAGGRTGNNVYIALEQTGEQFPGGRWGLARNHSWQAWRERYRNNAVLLSIRIAEIVQEKGYTAASKAAYRHDRRLNKRAVDYMQQEDEEQDDEEQGEFVISESEEEMPPVKRRRVSGESNTASHDASQVRPLKTVARCPGSQVAIGEPGPSNPQRTRVDLAQASRMSSSIRTSGSLPVKRSFVDLTLDSDDEP